MPVSAPPTLDVVTLGEAMALLVAGEPGPLDEVTTYIKRTAGAETNVAIGLSRLGLRVGWVSRLGEDSWGRYLHRAMSAEGIDCSHVQWDPDARTGMMIKEHVTDGRDPRTEYHRRGSAASRLLAESLDKAWLQSARHLHATGIFPALSPGCDAAAERAIRLMRGAGRSVSFDPNLRPALWPSREAMVRRINALAAQCDWVLPGVDEGEVLCGTRDPRAIARFYLDRGVRLVAVKLGAEGAYWANTEGSGRVQAFPVERVVDTVGAGDGFAVGLISALLQGRDPASAVRRGAWIGARAVQVRGDTEGLPTAAELAAAGL